MSVEEELLKLTRLVDDQSEMIGGLLITVNAAHTYCQILNRRCSALEARARMTEEDILSGKEMPPVGMLQEDAPKLQAIQDALAALIRKTQDKLEEEERERG